MNMNTISTPTHSEHTMQPTSEVSSVHKCRMAIEIIRHHFGSIMGDVARVMIERGPLTLPQLLRALTENVPDLSLSQARTYVALLHQHNLVVITDARELTTLSNESLFSLSLPRAILRSCGSLFLQHVRELHGDMCESVVGILLEQGRLTISVLQGLLQVRFPTVPTRLFDEAIQTLRNVSILMSCSLAPPSGVRQDDYAAADDQDEEGPSSPVSKRARKHPSTSKTLGNTCSGNDRNRSRTNTPEHAPLGSPAGMHPASFSLTPSSAAPQSPNTDQPLRLNIFHLLHSLRNDAIQAFLQERISASEIAANIVQILVEQDASRIPSTETGTSLGKFSAATSAISFKYLERRLPSVSADLLRSNLTALQSESLGHLLISPATLNTPPAASTTTSMSGTTSVAGKKRGTSRSSVGSIPSQGTGSEFALNLEHICDELRFRYIDHVIEHQMDSSGLRILRCLRRVPLLDERVLCERCMLPPHIVREKLYAMLSMRYVQIQRIPKGNALDRNPKEMFYLWRFDLSRTQETVLASMYHAARVMYNLLHPSSSNNTIRSELGFSVTNSEEDLKERSPRSNGQDTKKVTACTQQNWMDDRSTRERLILSFVETMRIILMLEYY